MSKSKLYRLLLGASVVSFLGLSATVRAEDIKIGFVGPLSGPVAVYGTEPLQAARVAVEEINASGTLGDDKLVLVAADSAANPAQAAQAARRMVLSDDVLLIIGGHTSAETQAVTEATRPLQVPVLSSLAQDSSLTQVGNKWFARTCLSTDLWGDAIARWLKQKHSPKTVYMLSRNDSYGQSLGNSIAAGLKKEGIEIIDNVAYDPQTKEFKPILAEVQKANPDFIVISGFYTDTGLLVKQMAELGIDKPYFNNTAPAIPQFKEIAGPAAEGAYGATYYLPVSIDSPKAAEFVEAWTKRTGKAPSQYEGMGYDAVYLVADAIRRAKESGELSRESVRDAIYATKDFDGVTGKTTITENGDVKRPLPFIQLKDGKPVLDMLVE